MTRRPQPAGGDARSAHRRQDRASIALDTSLHPMLRAGGQAVFTPDRLPCGERGVWGSAPRFHAAPTKKPGWRAGSFVLLTHRGVVDAESF